MTDLHEFDELMFFAQIKAKPGLYLGHNSLLSLRDYLFGMQRAFSIVYQRNAFEYLNQFIDWYQANKIHDQNGYACWWNHILYTSGGFDDQAFNQFFKVFEAYLQKEHGVGLPEAKQGLPVNDSDNHHLQDFLSVLVGVRLDTINLACEMMMFSFREYELHCQCMTRILDKEGIVVTTDDYFSSDDDKKQNNVLWQTLLNEQSRICGAAVKNVTVNRLYDVRIELDNGIAIETHISNGRFYDTEIEQWSFFRRHDHSSPYVTVYQNGIDIAEEW